MTRSLTPFTLYTFVLPATLLLAPVGAHGDCASNAVAEEMHNDAPTQVRQAMRTSDFHERNTESGADADDKIYTADIYMSIATGIRIMAEAPNHSGLQLGSTGDTSVAFLHPSSVIEKYKLVPTEDSELFLESTDFIQTHLEGDTMRGFPSIGASFSWSDSLSSNFQVQLPMSGGGSVATGGSASHTLNQERSFDLHITADSNTTTGSVTVYLNGAWINENGSTGTMQLPIGEIPGTRFADLASYHQSSLSGEEGGTDRYIIETDDNGNPQLLKTTMSEEGVIDTMMANRANELGVETGETHYLTSTQTNDMTTTVVEPRQLAAANPFDCPQEGNDQGDNPNQPQEFESATVTHSSESSYSVEYPFQPPCGWLASYHAYDTTEQSYGGTITLKRCEISEYYCGGRTEECYEIVVGTPF